MLEPLVQLSLLTGNRRKLVRMGSSSKWIGRGIALYREASVPVSGWGPSAIALACQLAGENTQARTFVTPSPTRRVIGWLVRRSDLSALFLGQRAGGRRFYEKPS